MATSIHNYILRIYRLDRKNPKHLVGLVEQVGCNQKKAFTNLEELWMILSQPEQRDQEGGVR